MDSLDAWIINRHDNHNLGDKNKKINAKVDNFWIKQSTGARCFNHLTRHDAMNDANNYVANGATNDATNGAINNAGNPFLSLGPDRWRGIGIDSSLHLRPLSLDACRCHLDNALLHWTETGIRPVTVKIHESDSAFIPVFVSAGFSFHHAQPGYVYLKRWLPEDEPDGFPAYANHYLGVAGFVVDPLTDELLVIKERFAPKPIWKLPGGTADCGEDLHQIARREVLEETGISTEFVGVICFRHMHNFRYGCSDFYFVCHLRPLNKEIKMDESEIAECRWMKVDEYLEHQAPTEMNKHFVRCYQDYLKQDKFSGVIGKKAIYHHINKVDYNVYSIFGVDSESNSG